MIVLLNVSPSWSSAYGMFTQGKANLVFSYFTSAVYHWTKEKDFTYQPLLLENVKYPVQVEYAAVPERCKHCTLANDFVNFLLSEPSQKIIMNKNIMLPVIAGVTQGSGFDQLNYGETMSQQDYEKIAPKKKELIERWSGLIRK